MLETRAAHPRPFSISVFDPHEASAKSWEKFHRYWLLRTEEDHPGERRTCQQLTAVTPRWRNAEVNAPMLSINHRLGFAPHRHDAVYQIGPESLRAFLSTRPLDPMERYQ